MTLLRALAGLILGLVVFGGLIYYLVVVNFSQRLEDPDVYKVAISDTDAYNRIYDEVLVDEALEDQTGNLAGGLEVVGNEDVVDILRDVMPPAYLREQTEDNIDRFTSYLKHDVEDLEVYVDLKEPLERISPAVLKKVHQVIDELEIQEPGQPSCGFSELQSLAFRTAESFSQLSNGELPESVPSLEILTGQCREDEFEQWFEIVLDSPTMNSEAAIILESQRPEIKDSFADGDTRAFLKTVADPLLEPLVEDAVSDIRRDLQRNDRFDILDWLAGESEDTSRADIEEQAESLREVVSAANGQGRVISLVMIILGILLMAAVHVPKPAEMLRWPGVTMLMGGGVCLVVGFIVNSAVPSRINDAVSNAANYSADVPVAAVNLGGDLFESFARQTTAGFIPEAVTIMVLGGVLIGASFFAEILWGLVKRVLPLPGRNGNRR